MPIPVHYQILSRKKTTTGELYDRHKVAGGQGCLAEKLRLGCSLVGPWFVMFHPPVPQQYLVNDTYYVLISKPCENVN